MTFAVEIAERTALPLLCLSPLNHCLGHSVLLLACEADLRHLSHDSSSTPSPPHSPARVCPKGRGRMCFTTCGPVRAPKAHISVLWQRGRCAFCHFCRQCFSKGHSIVRLRMRSDGTHAPTPATQSSSALLFAQLSVGISGGKVARAAAVSPHL